MSVQHIWNLFQLSRLFLAVNLQIYLETLSLKHAKNIPETTRHRLYCEKLGTSYDVTGFAIGSFLEHIVVKEQMMTSFRKTLKTLVWSVQNQLITSEICPENKHKIGHFLPIAFRRSLRENLCKIPAKSTDSSAYLSLKILQNLTFFCALSEALAWVAVEWCPTVSRESFWDSVWPNC